MKKLKETIGLIIFVIIILIVFVMGIRQEMTNGRMPMIEIPPCLDTT